MSDEQPGEGKGIYYAARAFCLPDLLSRLKWGGRRAQPPQVKRRGGSWGLSNRPRAFRQSKAPSAGESPPKCWHRISRIIPAALTYHLALNFTPSGKVYTQNAAQPPSSSSSSSSPTLLILRSRLPPVPQQPRAAAATAAKHRAGLAASQ